MRGCDVQTVQLDRYNTSPILEAGPNEPYSGAVAKLRTNHRLHRCTIVLARV